MRLKTLIPHGLVLILAVWCGRADATTQYAMDLEELTYVADRIVVGTVLEIEARHSLNGQFIFTFADIEVDEVLKGSTVDGLLTVWSLGGTVDGITMRVHGTADLEVGERVLLFLEQDDHGLSVLGWAQGKFAIEWSPERGETLAIRGPASTRRTADPDPDWTFTLDELRQLVVSDVAAGHVPSYREIPGLLEHKRNAFRSHWGLPQEGGRP